MFIWSDCIIKHSFPHDTILSCAGVGVVEREGALGLADVVPSYRLHPHLGDELPAVVHAQGLALSLQTIKRCPKIPELWGGWWGVSINE